MAFKRDPKATIEPSSQQARKRPNMAKTTGYDTPTTLTKRQEQLLTEFGLPIDFEHLTNEQYFAIDERMSNEMMTKGINDSGDGLNDYGELCESVIIALPDDPVKQRA